MRLRQIRADRQSGFIGLRRGGLRCMESAPPGRAEMRTKQGAIFRGRPAGGERDRVEYTGYRRGIDKSMTHFSKKIAIASKSPLDIERERALWRNCRSATFGLVKQEPRACRNKVRDRSGSAWLAGFIVSVRASHGLLALCANSITRRRSRLCARNARVLFDATARAGEASVPPAWIQADHSDVGGRSSCSARIASMSWACSGAGAQTTPRLESRPRPQPKSSDLPRMSVTKQPASVATMAPAA